MNARHRLGVRCSQADRHVMGTARSTGVAALFLGRRFVGGDSDRRYVQAARRRLFRARAEAIRAAVSDGGQHVRRNDGG